MRFYLQMGYGMMGMNRTLLQQFGDGLNSGVILWPRTLDREQVERHAREIHAAGGAVLFDTCFYVPNTERSRILNFPYWDNVSFETGAFTGPTGAEFCQRVIEYQAETLNVTEILLPGRYTNVRNEDWLAMHRLFADTAAEMATGRPVYSTIALGPDVMRDLPSLNAILDEVTSYPVDGMYFLYRPPNDEYLTTDETFLVNLLIAMLSLALADKEVLVGYSSQQDLLLAGAGVRTIASGNYRNVRCFNPDIFDEEEEEERRKRTWYYDGRSLCEFRPQQLGLAYQHFNLRGEFGPNTGHSDPLLSAPNPAVVPWSERESFRHFLTVLRNQWLSFRPTARNQRLGQVRHFLDACAAQLALFRQRRFPLGDRSSADALTSYRNAAEAFLALEEERVNQL
jgi:hypothetical protein